MTISYEQLRRGVLEARSSGGHFGLVILMREGIAAWMSNTSHWTTTVTPPVATDRSATQALIADDLRADMARVFASMVMTTTEEKCA